MTRKSVRAPQGDTVVMRFTALDDGVPPQPIDLSGAAIIYTIAPAAGRPGVVTKTVGAGITVVSPASDGVFDVQVDPADTDPLAAGVYYHEVELTESDGRVSTVLHGDVTLMPTSIP